MNTFQETWPIGQRVLHKEYDWPGRIIGNEVTVGHSEVQAMEVNFYFREPPYIKYAIVTPNEIYKEEKPPD